MSNFGKLIWSLWAGRVYRGADGLIWARKGLSIEGREVKPGDQLVVARELDETTRQWVVSLTGASGDASWQLQEKFSEDDVRKAKKLQWLMQRAVDPQVRTQGVAKPFAAGFVSGVLFLAGVALILPSKQNKAVDVSDAGVLQPSYAAAAPKEEALSKKGAAPAKEVLPAQLTPRELEAVKSAQAIVYGQKGRPILYAFVDPLCPGCRAIDPVLDEVAKEFEVHLIPVGFHEGSERLLTQVLCHARREQAWHEAILRQFVSGSDGACLEHDGPKWAKQSNELFLRLGFEATPTLVTGHGVVGSIEGGVTAEMLKRWISVL